MLMAVSTDVLLPLRCFTVSVFRVTLPTVIFISVTGSEVPPALWIIVPALEVPSIVTDLLIVSVDDKVKVSASSKSRSPFDAAANADAIVEYSLVLPTRRVAPVGVGGVTAEGISGAPPTVPKLDISKIPLFSVAASFFTRTLSPTCRVVTPSIPVAFRSPAISAVRVLLDLVFAGSASVVATRTVSFT